MIGENNTISKLAQEFWFPRLGNTPEMYYCAIHSVFTSVITAPENLFVGLV